MTRRKMNLDEIENEINKLDDIGRTDRVTITEIADLGRELLQRCRRAKKEFDQMAPAIAAAADIAKELANNAQKMLTKMKE